MKLKHGMGVAVLLGLLTACGGGGGDVVDAAQTNDVPASATASPAAYSHYVGSLAADDRADPLSVEHVVAPTSESADPISVL